MFDEASSRPERPSHHCKNKEELLEIFDECFTLAQAYIPFQKVDTITTPETGLALGTIFPKLFRPYVPRQGHCHHATSQNSEEDLL